MVGRERQGICSTTLICSQLIMFQGRDSGSQFSGVAEAELSFTGRGNCPAVRATSTQEEAKVSLTQTPFMTLLLLWMILVYGLIFVFIKMLFNKRMKYYLQ